MCVFVPSITTRANMSAFDTMSSKIQRSGLSRELKEVMTLFVELFKESDAKKDAEIIKLKTEVTTLQKRLEVVENKLDETNQYSRLDTLTISAKKDPETNSFLPDTLPVYDNAENTKNIVRELFRDHLSLELHDNDISIAHRLQPPKRRGGSTGAQQDRRSIVVRFCRKDLIGTVFSHCKQNPPPFYVNESLTPQRRDICYALRKLKRSHGDIIDKVRTFKGVPRVFVKTPSEGRQTRRSQSRATDDSASNLARIDIPNALELEKFVRDKLETTLQEQQITLKNRL